ncbi:MAG: DNA-processing protein DprA [Pyrinomonadaceae bacterium]|nr:DNA-processing protein DprA [Pyrinomonadaceae bacterium]
MNQSDESLVLFALGSRLSPPDEPDVKPLTTREWSELERKFELNSINVSALPGLTSAQIESVLQIEPGEADRIARLLARSEMLQQELRRLEALGIWLLTRFDEGYPPRLIERLGRAAPLMLYGAGDAQLLNQRGLAVIGSRNVDARGFELTELVGRACAESNLIVYSGGARGVDKTAMGAALVAGGSAAGLLADSLEKAVRASDVREAIDESHLVLATPYSPQAGFNVGTAMARNKLIYALSDFALVIASDAEKGGTWAGAEEALTAGWVPVFVIDGPDIPDGNRLLLKRGAIPFPDSFDWTSSLADWLESNAVSVESDAQRKTPEIAQGSLF